MLLQSLMLTFGLQPQNYAYTYDVNVYIAAIFIFLYALYMSLIIMLSKKKLYFTDF